MIVVTYRLNPLVPPAIRERIQALSDPARTLEPNQTHPKENRP